MHQDNEDSDEDAFDPTTKPASAAAAPATKPSGPGSSEGERGTTKPDGGLTIRSRVEPLLHIGQAIWLPLRRNWRKPKNFWKRPKLKQCRNSPSNQNSLIRLLHFWNTQDSGAKERVGERRPNILNSYPYCWYLCIHACFSKFHSCKVSFAGEEEQEEDEEPEEQEEQDDQEEQEEAPEDDDVLLREHQLKNKKGKAKKNDGKGEKPKGKGNKAKAKEKTEKKETGGVRKKPAMSNRSAASSSKPKSKPKRTAAKSAASPKHKGKSKKPQTKPASEKSQPPMKRVRTKSSPQEEDMYCKHMYTEIKGYVEKFTTEDAGEQFKRKAKHFCNFQLLHCSLEPYYTRQSCLVSVGADMTESGKPLTWSFSFSGKDEKNGPFWVFEMAASIACAKNVAPRLKNISEYFGHIPYWKIISFELKGLDRQFVLVSPSHAALPLKTQARVVDHLVDEGHWISKDIEGLSTLPKVLKYNAELVLKEKRDVD